MKSVLISIQPYWVFLIIAKAMGWNIPQEKKIEVRKTYPKAKNWNKSVKIYCSKDKKSFSKIPKEHQPLMEQFLGKVVGEFVCDYIFEIKAEYEIHDELPGNPIETWCSWEDAPEEYRADEDIEKVTCLSFGDIKYYMWNSSGCYCWHISDLRMFDKPKPLWDFMKSGAPKENELDEELCSYCEATDYGERKCYGTPDGPVMCEGAFCSEAYELYLDEHFVLKRPPQSWCYVEEVQHGSLE